MVLTFLLHEYFIHNLLNYPDHVIHVCKQDVLNIKLIYYSHEFSAVNLTASSTIDLSKLVYLSKLLIIVLTLINKSRLIVFSSNIDLNDRIEEEIMRKSVKLNVEGLSSLKSLTVNLNTDDVDLSIKNLPSLAKLNLKISVTIDDQILTRLFDQVPHIQELCLNGNLSYFNLDSLVNLKVLALFGTIDKSFNFELFKNLCYQLEDIRIRLTKNDEKNDEITFVKLFDNYYFPYLSYLSLKSINLKNLKKEFFDRFPMLRDLNISQCKIEKIERDSFSNLQQLCFLDLSNNLIEYIQKNAFSSLKNLQKLDLSQNKLKNFSPRSKGIRESTEFCIRDNYRMSNFRFARQRDSEFYD